MLLPRSRCLPSSSRPGRLAERRRRPRPRLLAPVFKHDLPNLTMDDWEVTVSYVDYEPGRRRRGHHHAGFVLVYRPRRRRHRQDLRAR
jgi:hypothetical protein